MIRSDPEMKIPVPGSSEVLTAEVVHGIREEMAMKLSRALGGSPQFWLNLQNNWELSQLNETDFKKIPYLTG